MFRLKYIAVGLVGIVIFTTMLTWTTKMARNVPTLRANVPRQQCHGITELLLDHEHTKSVRYDSEIRTSYFRNKEVEEESLEESHLH